MLADLQERPANRLEERIDQDAAPVSATCPWVVRYRRGLVRGLRFRRHRRGDGGAGWTGVEGGG